MNDAEIMTEREVERGYGLKRPWLRRTRRERRGIPYLKLGRMVRYRRADIETFLASHMVETANEVTRCVKS